jgi:hypothetical protein
MTSNKVKETFDEMIEIKGSFKIYSKQMLQFETARNYF